MYCLSFSYKEIGSLTETVLVPGTGFHPLHFRYPFLDFKKFTPDYWCPKKDNLFISLLLEISSGDI